jgi:hypothetical protein
VTAWILIAFFSSGYNGGVAVARFDDKPACEYAISQMNVSMAHFFDKGVCVPAGSAEMPK